MSLQTMMEPALYGFIRSVLRNLSSVMGKGLGSSFQNFDPAALKQLEQKLSQFQDLLIDAERRKINKEHSVSSWMEDLNEVVYDMDDIIDETNILWHEIQQATSQVQVPHSFTNIWHTSNALNSKIKKISDRLDDLAKVADVTLKLRRDTRHENWRPIEATFRSETSPIVDESEVYGREEDKKTIIELLLSTGGESKKNYVVIPIVGMGGIGKTTLAQIVFEDERIKSFFDVHSWVCVSDVFDVAKVTKEIIDYAAIDDNKLRYCALKESHNMQSLGVLQATLKKTISNKKLLLVLDDVWTTMEWDKLKAPLNYCAKDSKILVTSRSKDVTNGISHRIPYELGVLDSEHSWTLFKENAFGEIDCDIDEDLERTGKTILEKCGGVPLAIKVMGALLQGAAEEKWKAVLKNELWHVENDKDDKIFPALKLSYYYLPSPLKRCFQYFSIFPADHDFEKDDLVIMWIAEGFIEAEEGRLLEDVGTQYYNELKGRSLIQGNNRMHDLIHSLACIMAEKFFCRVHHRESHSYKSLAGCRHLSFSGNKSVSLNEFVFEAPNLKLLAAAESPRTVFLHRVLAAGQVFELPTWKSLRVLKLVSIGISVLPSSICDMKQLRYLCFGDPNTRHFPESICNLIHLQVLDLCQCVSLQNIPENVGYLQNLTFLNLYDTRISSLPESVCNLYNLHVLVLINCRYLSHLPERIGNLRRLKKLLLSSSSILSVPMSILKITSLQVLDNSNAKLPPSIGKLANLEQLNSYPVGKRPRRGIGELKGMNRLKGKLAITCMENVDSVESAIMADMKNKKHINELAFMWSSSHPCIHSSSTVVRDGEMEAQVVEALEPHDPAALLSLTFWNYSSDRFPYWMPNVGLFRLTSLNLDGLLHLSRVVNMELPSLKWLIFANCPKLREALMVVPKLGKLEVYNCKVLKATALVLVPSNLERLTTTIVSQLESLVIDYIYLDYFVQQVHAGHRLPMKLQDLVVSGFLINITSMPIAWLSTLAHVKKLTLKYFPRPKLQLLHVNEHYDFPISLLEMTLCDCPSLTDVPRDMHKFSSLRHIVIATCPSLVSIQPEALPKNLFSLRIYSCESLRFLPEGLNNFTSLLMLYTYRCPQLEVRQNHQFPPNLQNFYIWHCPRLEQQLIKEDKADWLHILG